MLMIVECKSIFFKVGRLEGGRVNIICMSGLVNNSSYKIKITNIIRF